jgi:hypothetical protein
MLNNQPFISVTDIDLISLSFYFWFGHGKHFISYILTVRLGEIGSAAGVFYEISRNIDEDYILHTLRLTYFRHYSEIS